MSDYAINVQALCRDRSYSQRRLPLNRSHPQTRPYAGPSRKKIDFKRTVIDSPTNPTNVPHKSYSFKHLILIPIALAKPSDAAGSSVVDSKEEA
ncbi:hypothetical protein BDN70DRAFT_935984 [Pholiota conissans]|uniref:Uncharacterized protein n=1 Tax=Pholiota conissans TaxID=109636 RepID=A0A9P5YVE8_9AGAR|nr:hypothetical protein BDN70DRAFT_935984 [Pholiota conissans]